MLRRPTATFFEQTSRIKIGCDDAQGLRCLRKQSEIALFIVKCGRLNVMDERERVSDVLTNGRMFGEVAVLNSSVGRQLMKQQSIVRSIGYSELYVLTREDLWLSLVDYPNCAQEMMKKARSLQHRNHEDDGKSNELFNVEIKLPTTYEEKLNSMLKVVNAFTEELEQFEHRCHLIREFSCVYRKTLHIGNNG
ncbi:Cyclic nucleotide-binding domain-containing protein [Aphelenchoides besseyi]|nr:Cyclic nucleotide-binding domain-containing protein [Aphelenchoides besseyi]